MAGRIKKPVWVMLLLVLLTAGCGKSTAEKTVEAQAAMDAVKNARTTAEATYDGLYDDSLFVVLSEAGKQADELTEKNIGLMSDEELEKDFLPAAEELLSSYKELQGMLDEIAENERAADEIAGNTRRLQFSVINRSGSAIRRLTWAGGTGETLNGYLGQEITLEDGETIAGISVDVLMASPEDVLHLFVETSSGETADYIIGGVSDLNEQELLYLTLGSEGACSLTSDPADISPKKSVEITS